MTDKQLRELARRGGFWLRITKRGRVIATRGGYDLLWDCTYYEKFHFWNREGLIKWLLPTVEKHEQLVKETREIRNA
jgi:hypothetical protein